LADALAQRVRAAGIDARIFSIRDFDANDVLLARVEAPSVREFVESVKGAAAIVLATPVYKGIYSGGLKAIVDLVPPDALVGRPALGIATARLAEHATSAAHAYRDLFAFFRARTLDALTVLDSEFEGTGESLRLGLAAQERADVAARSLLASVGRG
jgi:FMN reductase